MSSKQSPDSLLHPDRRREAEDDDDGPPTPPVMAGIETLVNAAKGQAKEAKEAALRAEKKVDVLSIALEEKFAMLFGDVAMVLKGQGRLESRVEVIDATQRVFGAKQAAGERDFQQLARETGGHSVSLAELERRLAAAERVHAQNTSKYAVDRVRLDERISWLDKRQDKIEGVAVETGKHAAVAEEFARHTLESVNEAIDERKEQRVEKREVAKEKREIKWHALKWALGLLGALLLAGSGYALKACGVKDAPALTVPVPGH